MAWHPMLPARITPRQLRLLGKNKGQFDDGAFEDVFDVFNVQNPLVHFKQLGYEYEDIIEMLESARQRKYQLALSTWLENLRHENKMDVRYG